jgi:hypothetical protein
LNAAACAKFAKLFRAFNQHLEAAKVQGFHWGKLTYKSYEDENPYNVTLAVAALNVVDFRTNPKLAEKWQANKH